MEVRRKWLLPTNGNQEVLLVYESHFYMQLIKFSCLLQSFLLQPVKGQVHGLAHAHLSKCCFSAGHAVSSMQAI